MSNEHLSLRPKHGRPNDGGMWWYEEKGGILVLVDRNKMLRPIQGWMIPWAQLRAALDRKDRQESR